MGALILVGVILAAIVGVYARGYSTGVDSGREAQLKDDRPKIERLQKDFDNAVGANRSLQADLKIIDTRVEACNSTVATLGLAAEAAKSASADARAAYAARSRTLEADIARRQQNAAAAVSMTPAQQCETARNVLGDLADEMRGAGATPEAPAAAQPTSSPAPFLTLPQAAWPAPSKPSLALPPGIRRPKP